MKIILKSAIKDSSGKEHAAGSKLTVDDAIGKAYIGAHIAEEAPAEDTSALALMTSAMQDAVQKAFVAGAEQVQKAWSTKGAVNHPNGAGGLSFDGNIEGGLSEAEKQKSPADYLKHLTIVQCPRLVEHGWFSGDTWGGKPITSADVPESLNRLAKVYHATYNMSRPSFVLDAKTKQLITKDLAESSGTTGGYTVAPTYEKELLKLAAEESVVRPWAKVKQIPGREAFYSMLNQTFTPAGTQGEPQSAFYGGVQMEFISEAIARPQVSEPNFKQVHIATNECAGLAKISRTLLSDSFIAIESELKDLFAGAMAFTEDYTFLQGNGFSQPLGVLNSAALITYSPRSSTNVFKLQDAANMMGSLVPQCRPKAVWVMANSLYPQLVQLLDGSGRATFINAVGTDYQNASLAKGNSGLLLFGRPVIFTEHLNYALGVAGDVLLADFSKYIVADTGTLEIAASDQYAFNTNQITYRIIKRFDGKPQIDNYITQADGSTKISAFVSLHA